MDERSGRGRKNQEVLRFPSALLSATPEEKTKDLLNTLIHARQRAER